MASNFPSSLDTFTNPSSTDAMDSVSVPHATQHSDLNDAVEALEAKVGADGSAVTTSHDYKIADHASRITTLEASTLGIVAYTSALATTSTVATTPLAVLSLNATIVPNRRYRIFGKLNWQPTNNVLSDRVIYVTCTGMTTTILYENTEQTGLNHPYTMAGEFSKTAAEMGVTSGSGSSLTFTMYFRESANNGALNTNPNAIVGTNSHPQEFYIEDIGAA